MPAIVGKKLPLTVVFQAMKDQIEPSYNQKEGKWCWKWPQKLRIASNAYNISQTMKTFYFFWIKGIAIKCRFCQLEGIYFQQERYSLQKKWHLVLYGVTAQGSSCRITLDHIVPQVVVGNRHSWQNIQILCKPCNEFKGQLIPAHLPHNLQEMVEKP